MQSFTPDPGVMLMCMYVIVINVCMYVIVINHKNSKFEINRMKQISTINVGNNIDIC